MRMHMHMCALTRAYAHTHTHTHTHGHEDTHTHMFRFARAHTYMKQRCPPRRLLTPAKKIHAHTATHPRTCAPCSLVFSRAGPVDTSVAQDKNDTTTGEFSPVELSILPGSLGCVRACECVCHHPWMWVRVCGGENDMLCYAFAY